MVVKTRQYPGALEEHKQGPVPHTILSVFRSRVNNLAVSETVSRIYTKLGQHVLYRPREGILHGGRGCQGRGVGRDGSDVVLSGTEVAILGCRVRSC
jgi:hypothetical protein